MPEHFHLLATEPEVGDPSVVMKVIKERFTRQLNRERSKQGTLVVPGPAQVWQKRFYDFHVWSERKRIEKLRYMHRNPVKRGLVDQPNQWDWSSFRAYASGERGTVRVTFQEWGVKLRPVERSGLSRPLIRKVRE